VLQYRALPGCWLLSASYFVLIMGLVFVASSGFILSIISWLAVVAWMMRGLFEFGGHPSRSTIDEGKIQS